MRPGRTCALLAQRARARRPARSRTRRSRVGAVGEPRERVGVVVRADDQLARRRPRRRPARVEAAARRRRAALPASASMRPSWPPPMHPTTCMLAVKPLRGSGSASTASVCSRAEALEHRAQLRARAREDRRREQRGVDRAGLADRERADRDAGRHLHDREQRVEPLRRARLASARRAPAGASSRRPCPAGGRRRRRRRSCTSSPRASARPAYSNSRSGVRWAETTRVSCGTPSALERLRRRGA